MSAAAASPPTASLEAIGPDIWIADGPSVPFLGFAYPTRMTIVRLGDGSLWICSPIRLDDALASAVEKLGRPRHLIAANKLHHLFLGDWQQRWRDARLYAAPGLVKKRPDLHFDARLTDIAEAAWSDVIDQVVFAGSVAMDEAVFFHRPSRTAIFTDLIQRFDPAGLHGWRGWFMRLDGLVGENGSAPREWRLTFLRRGAARRAKGKVLAWDATQVVVAHGMLVRHDARATLMRALGWIG